MNAIKLTTEELAKFLVDNVENGTYTGGYDREYKDQFLYSIYKGKHEFFRSDETMPGVTVKFKAHYGPETTIVYCDNLKRAYEIVEYQETNRDSIKDAQQKLGDYIRKNKMY
jgi:hypothetical protein